MYDKSIICLSRQYHLISQKTAILRGFYSETALNYTITTPISLDMRKIERQVDEAMNKNGSCTD